MRINDFSVIRENLTIRGKEYFPGDEGKVYPAIIICHGFGADMRGEFDTCDFFASHGYAAFTLDFAGGSVPGAGTSDGQNENMSIWTEERDLVATLNYVRNLPYIDETNVTLYGSSQGGIVCGMTAADNPEKVARLIMRFPALCIPDDARAGKLGFSEYDAKSPSHVIECPNGFKIGRHFHDSVVTFNPFEYICRYTGDVLIMHGTKDEVVNYGYSVIMQKHFAEGKCHLQLIRDEGHGFKPDVEQNARISALMFMEKHREILTIRVQCTSYEVLEHTEEIHVGAVFFTGYCDNEYFCGVIMDGAKDVQTTRKGEETELLATYTLTGKDFTGADCRIDIVNKKQGEFYHPAVSTDSAALSFLNEAPLTATLENFEGGLTVRIFD